jgi:protein-S-isoprenylcysteine O-methyltransferase Ste14
VRHPLAFWIAIALSALGYCIFYEAINQRDAFLQWPDPMCPSLRHHVMCIGHNTLVLISGLWGVARHPNLLGEWIMGLSWCLFCGMSGWAVVVPYCIYHACVLVQWVQRDEAVSRADYGEGWDNMYCAKILCRIVPHVY